MSGGGLWRAGNGGRREVAMVAMAVALEG